MCEKTVMEGREYRILRPVYMSETIYMPLFSTKIFTRPVISHEEAERLIEQIPTLSAQPVYESKVQLLSRKYETALKTGQCSEILCLAMSIYNKKTAAEEKGRKLGLVDERFMKKAEELLFGELAVALGIAKEEVPKYIKLRIEQLKEE